MDLLYMMMEGSIFVMRGKCSDVEFHGIIFVIVQGNICDRES
jgi:hypothetical protein